MTPTAAASWRALAPLFESGDAEEAAERLGQLDPEEAAQVLRGLDPERGAEILNALPKERYKAYLDAWRRSGGDQGKKP
jgi:flagellar motility protein MotE (MotC chaperone)